MSASAMPPRVNRQPYRWMERMSQMGASKAKEHAMATSQIRSSQRGTAKTLIVALLAVCWPSLTQAQGTLSPVAQQVFLDNSGNPINNGKICTYAAGTLTPIATYSDVTLMTANANPIRTSSAGRPTTGGIYLSPASYKFVLLTAGTDNTCSTGTTIYTQDNVTAVPTTSSALDVTGTAGETLALGNVVYLSDGSGTLTAGRWYKADADLTYASATPWIGIATAAIASGSSGSIRIGGLVTGLSALTTGTVYYVSGTAGALTSTAPNNARSVGQAQSTTSLVLDPNPPPAVTTSPIGIAEGRLTLTSGVPVTTADVTGATSVYYTPYIGNRIALYDGTATWNVRTFSEITISLSGFTASKPYDIFAYDNAGVVTIETLVWTDATNRATAIVKQNGVWVKSGATTRRLLGTIYINSSGGQTDDAFTKRNVSNATPTSRVRRPMRRLETTASWTYTTATWRQANAATANQLEFVVSVAEVPLSASVLAMASNDGAGRVFNVGIGLDSTSTLATGCLVHYGVAQVVNFRQLVTASLVTLPAVGRHLAVWLEQAEAAGTTTWSAVVGVAQAGIQGDIDG